MSLPRFAAAALLVTLVVATGAGAGTRMAAAAPTGLHGFLLRADEPAQTSFPRTPAFAWNPVSGADHYEFQLSTSDTFRDNAIVWTAANLQSPVAAPSVSLPWITGSPHSLYARSRAVLSDGTVTNWSSDFGFDVVPTVAPTPLPSTAGLLRWTPVEGADGYEIWLVDVPKHEFTYSNVLDEREFYTFHQTSAWIGTIRWRVRAMRDDMLGRLNGVPVTQYGPWSPIYVSSNPAVTGGPIKLGSTYSDVVSSGSPSDPAHRLIPGFTWTGNQTMQGAPAELFRVYVFTDSQCLNRVYTGAVVGSPSYSGRPFGPLALPSTIGAARNVFLADGSEPQGTTFDGEPVTSSESATDATPTTTLPLAPTGGGTTGSGSGTSGGSGSGSGSGSGQSSAFLDWGQSKFGAPVDLWDTNWPSGGYYWTVVPVTAVSPGSLQTVVAAPGAIAAAATIPVTNTQGFAVGDQITIGNSNADPAVITAVDTNSISLASGLKFSHGAGEPVLRTGGATRYVDMELAQDACNNGRVKRFGVSSEPALSGAGDAFASGLGTNGQLTSASNTSEFYRPPLVAWTPALRAEAYQVQWSKTKYPFVPEADPVSGAAGIMTGSTSYVLPVAAGTWYYRVRGYDYSLPTGSQQMGWSDTTSITVGKPVFTVVGDTGLTTKSVKPKAKIKTKAKAKKTKSKSKAKQGTSTTSSSKLWQEAGFSVSLPTSWKPSPPGRNPLILVVDSAAGTKNLRGVDVGATVAQASPRGTQSPDTWGKVLAAANSKFFPTTYAGSTSIDGHAAVLLTWEADTVPNGSKTSVHAKFTRYVVDGGTQTYGLEFWAATNIADQSSATFAQIASSFRIG